MLPHTFVRGQCNACGVLETLLPGLRGSPLDSEPRPHHTDPRHCAWAGHCGLCQRLKAYVTQQYAEDTESLGGRFP